jgi:tRNA pseudouridine55 synthase
LRFVSDLDKSYTAEVVLGTATSTLDASGEVTATAEMPAVTIGDVTAAAATLSGTISQIPPMVSAIRVGGKRLYELARAGEEIERAPRDVVVSRFDVALGDEPGIVRIEVDCSSGTYVRSLAADLGIALGGVAHLRNLVRTRIGPFALDDAVPIADVTPASVRPAIELIGHLASVEVDPETAVMITHGRVLARQALAVAGDGPWIVTEDGKLLAVYESHSDGRVKPTLVYAAAGPFDSGDSVAPDSFGAVESGV